jgi:pimeloyl-ACP methyl ester carboxylesterase
MRSSFVVVLALGVALLAAPLAPARAATLPAPPAPAESFDIGTLHVDRYGVGDPIVLIPGLACGAWEWNGVIPHLAAAHTVYALTLAGFAGRPPQGAPSFAAFVRDLNALLDERKLIRPVLIGHSLGGTLALAYAEQHASRLRGLILVDGLPTFPDTEELSSAERQAMAQRVLGGLRDKTPADIIAFETALLTSGGVSDSDLAAPLAALTTQSDPTTVVGWVTADIEIDLRPHLGAITVPIDEIVPYDPSEANPVLAVHYTELQKRAYYITLFPRARKLNVATIAPSKFFVMYDQPDRFSAMLDAFLATM